MRYPLKCLVILLLGLLATSGTAPAQVQPEQAPEAEAAAAVERCRSDDFVEQRDCYEALLHGRLREAGAGEALALLGRLAALDEDVLREGHAYAHGIGIAALTSLEEVGRVFASCTAEFQSGCYHGVIQSYFLALQRAGGEVTTAALDALCGDYREPASNSFLLFQCTHGLGHGLTILYRHDLPRALASCDLMSRQWDREMCYGGAFMENVVNATHPNHLIASSAERREDGGHGHHPQTPIAGGGEAEPAAHGHHGEAGTVWQALDPNDLHYPCSRMAEKYLNACYTIQTAAMLHFTDHDAGRAAAECGRAPERVRTTCFVSLGRDLSGVALTDPAEAVRRCALADEAFQPDCNVGVVQALVNLHNDSATGLAYCRLIAAAAGKQACYRAVGEQAGVLPDGPTRRQEACRGAEAGYVEACLGAPAEAAAPAPPVGG